MSLVEKIRVEYDADKGRFHIACPFYLNSVIKALPNRRWEKTKRYWSAPAIRANVEHIAEKFTPTITSFSDGAGQMVAESLVKYQEMRTDIRKTNRFPAWYPFKTKPRTKQKEALDKIYGNKAIALFMDMRTGKTKVVIDLACALRMEDKCDRVLIICPRSIRRSVWVPEIETHAPFPIDVYLLNTGKPKEFDKWLSKPHDFKWMIVGVESLAAGSAAKFCERFLLSGIKTICAVDESSKIKNHDRNRSQNVVKLGRMAETRIAMTGTPMDKGVMDLFMQFEFLDPNIIGMGDYYSFRGRYAIMGGYNNKVIIGYDNLPELMEIIEPFVFQVRKAEVFPDAPPKIYIRREVELNPEQRKLYVQMKKKKNIGISYDEDGNTIEAEKSITVQNSLELMLRLQEITGGLVSYAIPENKRTPKGPKFYRELIQGTNPKVEDVMACLEEYDGPTIIWCAYRDEMTLVANAITKKYGENQVVQLHGGFNEDERHINVNVKFKQGIAKYLVGNAATGAMGLDMSAAEIEIYFSNTFNFIDRDQSEERAFGADKKNGTLVIDLVGEGTVDIHIVQALAEKKDVVEYVRCAITELKDQIFGTLE